MKHRLDYAEITILPNNIIELVVNKGVELSIENIEEINDTLGATLTNDFAFLINNINDFTVPLESRFTMASNEKLKAMAFVYYNDVNKHQIEALVKLRSIDNWNAKLFNGLEIGWQDACEWLNDEMKGVS